MTRTPSSDGAADSVAALAAEDICHSLRLPDGTRLDLLRGVDLTVAPGEAVAVVGRSGSGKTTLLSILGLMLRPAAGRVRVGGVDASALGDAERSDLRNSHFGFVFQGYSLIAHLTAEENVALPLRYGSSPPRGEGRERVRSLMAAVGLDGLGRRYPRQLSGGEQQRVAIARALMRRPRVVLADEPTGALDVTTGERILALLRTVTVERGSGLVVVTHDPAVADEMDRTVLLESGQLTAGALGDRGGSC